jgi:DNA-binding NarL/FixJ family response regulator
VKPREKKIRVLVADDQNLFREMMVGYLERESDIQVVGQAVSGADTMSKTTELSPDVVLLDIQLGDLDGLEVTRAIKQRRPETRVVLLTGFHNEEYIYRAFQLGASGYLSKDTSMDRVLEAVRKAHKGDALLEPTSTTRIIREYERLSQMGPNHAESRAVEPPNGMLVKLTPREREILALIADGLSNQEIASRLFISEYTVKTHVSNLFRKLGINDRVQAVLYALARGIR